jgi:hypothetical protein
VHYADLRVIHTEKQKSQWNSIKGIENSIQEKEESRREKEPLFAYVGSKA